MPHAVSQAIPGTSPAPAALHVYRLVVWTAVMIAIIVLMRQPFPVLPEPPAEGRSTVQSGFADDFSGAAALKDLRDYSADSAPKQQVVNGWYTNDMLEIVGKQNDSLLQGQARLLEAQTTATSHTHDWSMWHLKDRRSESLLIIFGLGAAAHLAGSSLILLLAGRRRRTPRPGTTHDGGAVPSPTLEAQPEPQPFDPRPGH